MGKGIVIGFLLAALLFGAYIAWDLFQSDAPDQPSPEVSAQPGAETPATSGPSQDERNYPMFLAYLDNSESLSPESVQTCGAACERIAAYYDATPDQVTAAVFHIYEAQRYFPDLTYGDALQYLDGTVPANLNPKNPASRSRKSLDEVSEEIYLEFVAAYAQPQGVVEKPTRTDNTALRQQIERNLAAMRARGAAANAARDRAIAEHNARVQRNIEYRYNQFQRELARRTLPDISYWRWRF